MAMSTYLGNKVLDHVFKNTAYTSPTTVYISLHTSDPGLTGTSEVAGGSYARVAQSFASAASKANASNATINFTGMPAATVTYIGVWDASSAGNFLWGNALTASKTTASGDAIQFPSSSLTFTLS